MVSLGKEVTVNCLFINGSEHIHWVLGFEVEVHFTFKDNFFANLDRVSNIFNGVQKIFLTSLKGCGLPP
jgi:hypothetical protein